MLTLFSGMLQNFYYPPFNYREKSIKPLRSSQKKSNIIAAVMHMRPEIYYYHMHSKSAIKYGAYVREIACSIRAGADE